MLALLVLASPLASPAIAAGWRWPLEPPHVVRSLDPPDTPYGRGHRGVDLAGTTGQVVRAAGSGTVGYAGVLAGRGVVTVLHSGGLRTTYEPLTRTVSRGQAVSAGDPLGTLDAGHPGCPVAACLHWGLLQGDAYLDPLGLIDAGPVRLYPRYGPMPGAAPATSNPAPSTRDQRPNSNVSPADSVVTGGAIVLTALALRRRRGRPSTPT